MFLTKEKIYTYVNYILVLGVMLVENVIGDNYHPGSIVNITGLYPGQ